MTSKLFLSDNYLVNNYFRLLYLLLSNNKKTLSSVKTSLKLKLNNKKSLLRFYKKFLRFGAFSNTLTSYIVFSYCLLKKYLFTYFPWILSAGFNTRYLLFFVYHFLTLYRTVFVLKMLFDWFPIKNWERSSPLKRFLRRSTIGWTRPFENYLPSIFAWLLVINLIPMSLYFIEGFYTTYDLANFPTSYKFTEMTELVLESNLFTLKKRNIIVKICLRIWQNCGTKIARLFDKDLFKIYLSY